MAAIGDIFKCVFEKKKFAFSNAFHGPLVPNVRLTITINRHLFRQWIGAEQVTNQR